MNALSKIPDDFNAFLLWMKDRSEAAWANYRTKTFEEIVAEEMPRCSWRAGTRWQTGLDEPGIDALEQQWELQFPKDFRQFLSILNAPDRGMYTVDWSDETDDELEETDDDVSIYDWNKDDELLISALNWPLQGLLFDVEENSLWLNSWGKRPGKDTERCKKVTELVAAAPKLIPITGHRYLLASSLAAGNPVLSVWQSDIICYGSNLRNFLLLEYSDLLGLDYQWKDANEGNTLEKIAAIPFWGEIMLRD